MPDPRGRKMTGQDLDWCGEHPDFPEYLVRLKAWHEEQKEP